MKKTIRKVWASKLGKEIMGLLIFIAISILLHLQIILPFYQRIILL